MDGEADPYQRARTRLGCAVQDMVRRWMKREGEEWERRVEGRRWTAVYCGNIPGRQSQPVECEERSHGGRVCRSREVGGSQNHIEQLEVSERWRRRWWAGVQMRVSSRDMDAVVSGRMSSGQV